jgi:hypothetical protein
MMFNYLQILSAVLALSGFQQAAALPNGAAGCSAGNPLGGFHLSREQTTGDLATGGFEVLLDGQVLVPGEEFFLPAGESTSVITLRGIDAETFRGYLIRVDLGNGETMSLSPDGTGQVAPVCINIDVSGVTHTDNSDKASVSAEFTVDTVLTGAVSLEVTAVVANNLAQQSIWYIDAFGVNQFVPPVVDIEEPEPLDFPFSQFAFEGYVEPPFFSFYEGVLGADFMLRCARRQFAPANGSFCRREEKACLFGEQNCPVSIAYGGVTQPNMRCNCSDRTFFCQSFACPNIGPNCPAADPTGTDAVCSNDLTCNYGQSTM